jgi:pimeloyl-ACP methyl ester carboxylesterase
VRRCEAARPNSGAQKKTLKYLSSKIKIVFCSFKNLINQISGIVMGKILRFFWGLLLLCSCAPLFGQQHLVSYQFQQHYSIADVEQLLADAGVPSVLLRPEYAVDVYKVIYNTRNAQDTGNTTASGVVIVPTGVTCPLPLIAYAHGTTTDRYNVPSYGSGELVIGIIYSSGGGYITTMSDYLGLGDSPGFHPYVHARSEATAMIDLLRTTRELRDTFNFALNDQLFLFGYSQGGHAAMAAFKMLEEELSAEFTVTAAAPMSGPYDISGVQAGTITSGLPYHSPSYLPYVILGYQEAYGDIYTNLSDVFVAPYDSLIPILYDGTHSNGYVDARLPSVISDMITPTYYNDYLTNPNNRGRVALRDNDLHKWSPSAPLRMLYCQGDVQVFPQNSEIAFDTMVARGVSTVEKMDFGNYDHGGCVQFCLIDGFNFFNRYKNTRGGIVVNAQTTALSGSGATDASATIIASGGVAPYNFSWSNGLTTDMASGLGQGAYIVRVSDSRGCFAYQPVQVSLVASIAALTESETKNLFVLAPNPANDVVFVRPDAELQGGYTLILRNTLGQIVHQQLVEGAHSCSFSVANLAQGLYVAEIQWAGEHLSYKILVSK